MSLKKRMTIGIAVFLFACPTFVIGTRAETQSLETLLAYLKSPIAGTRRDAARKLGERRVRGRARSDRLSDRQPACDLPDLPG